MVKTEIYGQWTKNNCIILTDATPAFSVSIYLIGIIVKLHNVEFKLWHFSKL
jgi:hypothetical protein